MDSIEVDAERGEEKRQRGQSERPGVLVVQEIGERRGVADASQSEENGHDRRETAEPADKCGYRYVPSEEALLVRSQINTVGLVHGREVVYQKNGDARITLLLGRAMDFTERKDQRPIASRRSNPTPAYSISL